MPPTKKKLDGAKPTTPDKKRKRNKKKGQKTIRPNSITKTDVNEKSTQEGTVAASNVSKDILPANPLLAAHQQFLNESVTPQERDNFFSNALLDPDRRAELWMQQADVGEALVNQYSWAIPDERAIRILRHFSPLVEIGCGANAYWARLLTQAGVDIVAYDQFPEAGGQIMEGKKKKKKRQRQSDSFQVQKGGPEILSTKKMIKSGRTLFLCYSDEEGIAKPKSNGPSEEDSDNDEEPMTSLGTECLNNYTGDYLIHVGELYGDTTSMEQAPWGRSSGAAFQEQLAATFHCLLRASLPNWIHVKDTISVWKRSETCSIVFAADSDDEEDDDEEEVEYKHIPASERLPTDIAAPCLEHLLNQVADDDEEDDSKPNKAIPEKKQATQKEKLQQVSDTPSPSSSEEESDSSDSDSVPTEKSKNKKNQSTAKPAPSPKKKRQKIVPKTELSDDESEVSEDEVLPLNDEDEGKEKYTPEW